MQLKPVPLALCALSSSAGLMSFHSLAVQQAEAEKMTTVVVTATRIEQPLSETNGSVAVITSEDIAREGSTELYDVLSHEPGVSVSGGAGRPQTITIRGMSGNRIAVIKDGVKVADGYGASDLNDVAGHNSFDLGDVKQIEVVKGADSSLYGSGAIGGVVVLTSKTASDYLGSEDHYAGLEGGYSGISDKYTSTLATAARLGDTAHLVRVSYWQGSESKNHDQSLYLRNIDGFNAALTSEWFLNDSWTLKGKADYYQQQVRREQGIPPTQPDGGGWQASSFLEEGETSTLSVRAGAEWEGEALLAEQADINLYYRQTDTLSDKDIAMQRTQEGLVFKRRQSESRAFNDHLIGLSADLQQRAVHGEVEHAIAWGMELESMLHERPVSKRIADWSGDTQQDSAPFASARTHNLGVYLHDDIRWGKWNLAPGLRFDYQQMSSEVEETIGGYPLHDLSSGELSPSLSLAYQWTPALNSYLSYSHGFLAPSYAKAYGFVPHLSSDLGNFVIRPNADLEAETSDNLELGAKYDDGQLAVYGAVFYSVFDNFISEKTIGWNEAAKYAEVQYQNLDGVKTYGAEMSVSYWFSERLNLVSKLGIVDGEDEHGEPIRTLTPLEGNSMLLYLQDNWQSFVRVNYAGAMDKVPSCQDELGISQRCATTSGWMTLDAGAGFNLTQDFRLNASVHNLFDHQYTRYQDVAGVSEAQTTFSTEPGRYFSVNAKYSF
ncbi:TonB-dependent hemoglobin/transferrin/lactoferrin family receptor [Photobacterium sp. 2_MG-2023]|uniref:TonB-dependent hemoglobin/transferrin/lactoferrin family receptor n=1 Tax=Photobacterium sp. 2_MG-2023 TaxID=3062663 RepID=UPI0026E2CB94|nr:TonB-dependent hemoglobin/transferrin/lactoferrin family receptor [Photobacterium sp. 2_MG-2023]MDO6582029.1 TonB-dependent hemoglobin/transferrin/lactoferrin family receptor [Photobacterium sp. 2_MG-2023]